MIHALFPKTIYTKENILLDRIGYYKCFLESMFEKYGSKRWEEQYVDSSRSTFSNLHKVPEMKDLVNQIYVNGQKYLNLIGYSDSTISKLSIKNMWANISYKGDYLYPHIHGESLLSGAFYVFCDKLDKICFYDDISQSYLRPPDYINNYSQQIYEYPCIPGNLYLFKSNFMHGTTAQKSDKKIVISFNIV